MTPTPDVLRAALNRFLFLRDAHANAVSVATAANESLNAAQVSLNSAARDLAAQSGDGAFCVGSVFVHVRCAGPGANAPSITVCPMTDLRVVDAPAKPANPSVPSAAPVSPPVSADPKPASSAASAVPLSGGKIPDAAKKVGGK